MQALFRFRALASTKNAAELVEADGAYLAAAAAKAQAFPPVVTCDALRSSECAFDVTASHAGADLFVDDRAAPFAAGYSVAATVISFGDYRQAFAFTAGGAFPGLEGRHWHGFP